MPDQNGKLSEKELDDVVSFINEKSKLKDDACLVCGSLETFVEPVLLNQNVGAHGSRSGISYPVVPVTCPNCGFVRFFAARAVGIELPYVESHILPEDKEGEDGASS